MRTISHATIIHVWGGGTFFLLLVTLSSGAPAHSISELSAKATAQYHGDGLSVIPTAEGASLRCVFQKLDGLVTREGLWLTSTTESKPGEQFRVTACAVGRGGALQDFSSKGTVIVADKLARWVRPGLAEEYTVSMDGVRQDFVVQERPAGEGELALRLAVSGATVEPAAFGAQLVLKHSGRKIAYSRLRVTDATGRELSARMEAETASGAAASRQSAAVVEKGDGGAVSRRCHVPTLTVLVNDADAVYPVRIDPTFSDANWISMGGLPGAESSVYATVLDGSGNLYVGGSFTVIGDVVANRVAKWNGSSWSALGSGFDNEVYALAFLGSDLYAGGRFLQTGGNSASFIAKWNGTNWSALSSGMGNFVYALAVSGTNLYAGGTFMTAGGGAASRIAKWDGSSWSALGSGVNNRVNALAVLGTNLYAGGTFTTAGGGAANRIARWDGTNWSAVGLGVNNNVRALAVSGSDVYAGGDFTIATNSGPVDVTVNRIAKWDGSNWSALGLGMNNSVYSLAALGSDVYAGGDFLTATNSGPVAVTVNRLAKWNGSSWSALVSSGMNGRVNALVISGSDVFAGGEFTTAGGVAANYIAKWNTSTWLALGSGLNAWVNALAVSGSDLYAGGEFTTAGGGVSNRIARWNGSSWTALGSGMNNTVTALAASGSNVYAGGSFTTAGGSNVNFIAKWNGTNWSALGSGMNGGVGALAVSGSNVYAGGGFTTAGGSAAYRIAKWNGSSWSAVGLGLGGTPTVYALAVSGSNLYAGGSFTTATNSGPVAVTVNRIAKWDGTNWSALGLGVDDDVRALAVSGSNVYAGGDFAMATNSGPVAVTTNRIARWDGNAWSALGTGIGPTSGFVSQVNALAVSGSDVYAGGDFLNAGGNAALHIAKWDGNSWTNLGSGMGGAGFPNVNALAVSGSALYAGGRFTTAGGKASAYVARADIGDLIQPQLSILRSGANVLVSWPSPSTGFTLERTGSLSPPISWVSNSASITDDGTNKSVTLPPTNSAQFLRLRNP